MQFQRIGLIILLASMHYVHGLHQPDLLSFGDFMEYYLSVPLSCINVTNTQNVTSLITVSLPTFLLKSPTYWQSICYQKTFAECTSTIATSSSNGDMFGSIRSICENQNGYLQCWDQLKHDITTNCNQSNFLPAVYPATVKSYCGNDNGNLTISKKRFAQLYYNSMLENIFVFVLWRQFRQSHESNDSKRYGWVSRRNWHSLDG